MLQEDVSDDMVGLSARMLAGARAMQGAVQAREQLLSQTELAQDASAINSAYAVKTSKNIKQRYARHAGPPAFQSTLQPACQGDCRCCYTQMFDLVSCFSQNMTVCLLLL